MNNNQDKQINSEIDAAAPISDAQKATPESEPIGQIDEPAVIEVEPESVQSLLNCDEYAPEEIICVDVEAERKNCSRIGFGYAILTIITLVAATAIQYAVLFAFPKFFETMLFRNMVTPMAIYLFALPVLLIIISKCKAEPPEKKKIGFFGFMAFLIVGFGLMFIGNIMGNSVMSFLSALVGYDYSNMLTSIIGEHSVLVTIIFVVIVAPIGEELVFRKLLIDRTQKYGGAVCILLSGLMFGLMHANFYQFFYAFALGLVLGYLYYRTGRVIYPILIHAIINFFGSVVAPSLSGILDGYLVAAESGIEAMTEFIMNNALGIIAMGIYVIFTYSAMLWAVLLPIILRKKIVLGKGTLTLDNHTRTSIVFCNVGVVVMFIIYALEIVLNLVPRV